MVSCDTAAFRASVFAIRLIWYRHGLHWWAEKTSISESKLVSRHDDWRKHRYQKENWYPVITSFGLSTYRRQIVPILSPNRAHFIHLYQHVFRVFWCVWLARTLAIGSLRTKYMLPRRCLPNHAYIYHTYKFRFGKWVFCAFPWTLNISSRGLLQVALLFLANDVLLGTYDYTTGGAMLSGSMISAWRLCLGFWLGVCQRARKLIFYGSVVSAVFMFWAMYTLNMPVGCANGLESRTPWLLRCWLTAHNVRRNQPWARTVLALRCIGVLHFAHSRGNDLAGGAALNCKCNLVSKHAVVLQYATGADRIISQYDIYVKARQIHFIWMSDQHALVCWVCIPFHYSLYSGKYIW